jgi:hypothetical protein
MGVSGIFSDRPALLRETLVSLLEGDAGRPRPRG